MKAEVKTTTKLPIMSTLSSYKGKNMNGQHVHVYNSNGKEIARKTGSTREETKYADDDDIIPPN